MEGGRSVPKERKAGDRNHANDVWKTFKEWHYFIFIMKRSWPLCKDGRMWLHLLVPLAPNLPPVWLWSAANFNFPFSGEISATWLRSSGHAWVFSACSLHSVALYSFPLWRMPYSLSGQESPGWPDFLSGTGLSISGHHPCGSAHPPLVFSSVPETVGEERGHGCLMFLFP